MEEESAERGVGRGIIDEEEEEVEEEERRDTPSPELTEEERENLMVKTLYYFIFIWSCFSFSFNKMFPFFQTANIKRILIDILLSVTNDEIENVADQVYQKARKDAAKGRKSRCIQLYTPYCVKLKHKTIKQRKSPLCNC